jgi:pimeloyl-ACP methyl ester carboxylesterase
MKRILLGLLALALAWLNMEPIWAQRPVNWVHGLNAAPRFWANEQALFNAERRINGGSNEWYNTDNGVVDLATNVLNDPNTITGGTALAIGHSMGGLAVREQIRQNPANYQGVILCGAPLRGAKIMNSFQSGAVEQAINNGGWQVLRGPLSSYGITTYMIGAVVVNGIVPALKEIFNWNYVNHNQTYGAQTVNDLAENSGYMQGINTVTSPTPRVYIWGNENSPVHWRLLSSTKKYNHNEAWGNGEDQGMPTTISNVSDIYLASFITNSALAITYALALAPGPAIYFGWMAFEWKAGWDYLRKNSESDWASLIGAENGYVYNVSTYVTNTCSNEYYYGTCGQFQDPTIRQACQNNCFQTVSYNYGFAVQAGSDGQVSGASQRADATQWQVPAGDQYEAVGVNHIEMRGHTNMTTQFRRVFDRTDLIFTTPLR